MVAYHRSILAGAVLLVAGATNAGADYYGGMKDAPIAVLPPSWYVRGDVSHAWMDAGELSGAITPFSTLSIDNNWSIGGGVGRYFGRGFRGDLTYEYRFKSDVHGDGVCGGGSTITGDFDLKSSLLLANVYYDFRPYERFTPYVGLGVGAARHSVGAGNYVRQAPCGASPVTFGGDSEWSAAGALMAGFSFRIDRGAPAPVSIKDGPAYVEPGRLYLDVGYRFLYLGDAHAGGIGTPVPVVPTPGPRLEDITAQEIRIGLRWDIR
jgi:opacity protein-like surface antigen